MSELPYRVEKPWGYEIIWAKTDRYVGKILHINAGHVLSLQFHHKKDESIYGLSGEIILRLQQGETLIERPMVQGDAFHIQPTLVHQFEAVADSDLLEASTPEIDDVVRLKDRPEEPGRRRNPRVAGPVTAARAMNKRSRVLYSLWPAAWALSVGGGCLDDGIRPKGTRVARLEIFAAESALMVGHTLQLRAAAWDSLGNLVTVGGLVWWSTDPALVSVDTAGLVLATAGTLGGDVDVKVSAPPSPTVGVLRLHVAVPGELKWRLGLGPMPVTGGPTEGPDGTIYVVTVVSRSQALLHAVDPKGRVKWERVASGVLDNTPIVGPDGTVYVVGQNVSAFAPDGSMRWVRVTSNFPPDFQGAAISADGVL